MNRSGRPISRECKQFSNRLQLSANDLERSSSFFFSSLRKVHIKTELIEAECHLLGFHVMEVHWVKKKKKWKEGKIGSLSQCNSSITSLLYWSSKSTAALLSRRISFSPGALSSQLWVMHHTHAVVATGWAARSPTFPYEPRSSQLHRAPSRLNLGFH